MQQQLSTYLNFEQRSFRQLVECMGWPSRMVQLVDTGRQQKSFNCVFHASDSVCNHSFKLCLTKFVQQRLVLMMIPLSCLPILLFLHHPRVLSRAGLFAAYLATRVLAA
jgi:hypothetical protein